MTFKQLLLGGAALSMALSAPRDGAATTFMKTTLEERVGMSDLIIRGTVEEVWTEQNEEGVIWTRAQVAVSRVLKGDPTLETVVVDQLGGEWAGMHMAMPGGARFSVGESMLVMLDRLESGYLAPVGMHQGKFTVKMDPRLRQKIAVQFQVPNHRDYDHRFVPLPDEAQAVTLESLETRILRSVETIPSVDGGSEVKR